MNRPNTAYVARRGVLDGVEITDAYVEVDADGVVVRTGSGVPTDAPVLIHDLGRALLVPGLVNAHSHSFQHAIRGRVHRRDAGDVSDFWSWRRAMYGAVAELSPQRLYEVSHAAYSEMLASGITSVGEFHYVHHRPDGAPYDDPNELGWQVVRAARDVGIHLVLLDAYYARAGARGDLEPPQRRFRDRDVEAWARRIEALRHRGVRVGAAPHSVRAVGRDDLMRVADVARRLELVLHAHVSEQPRENDECRAEHGCSPLRLLEETGCLARPGRFTAVHAIHVDAEDLPLLQRHQVCACPTTEADLGDGIVPARDLRAAGAQLCVGSDSNAVVDLVQEARWLEMGERWRCRERLVLATEERSLGAQLLQIATEGGARSLGVRDTAGRLAVGLPFDACVVDLAAPSLREVPEEHALDAWMLAGTAQAVTAVYVAGVRRL